MSDEATDLPSGRKYEPLFELGRGGMATVYLAISRGLAGWSKLVVLKQLRSEIADDPEFFPMLLEEARIAARINHPNVVQTNEIGFDGRAHYIAMEYLEGQTLQEITRRLDNQGRRLPLPMYLHILCQALRGLHSAHELTHYDGAPLSIVHRDMTPHNVFVTYDGVVKVLDFGIAKAADSKNETRSGTFKGKLRYIAPEQALGIALDRRADLFAIGVMMWHALSGSRMWKGVSETDVLMQLAKGEIPRIAEAAPDAPPELLEICGRALAHRPEARFPTAAAMLDAIESYLTGVRPKITQRDIGQFAGELFEERRATVRAAIDQRLREGLGSDHVPMLDNVAFGTASGLRSPDEGTRSRSSSFPRAATFAMVALVATAAGFGVYQLATRKEAAPVSLAPPPSAAASTSAPANAAAGTKAHVKVSITPMVAARMRLDGAPFSGDAEFARDGLSHRLEIEAPGFNPESEYIAFDREEVSVQYALTALRTPAHHPPRPKSRDTSRAAVVDPAPAASPQASSSAAPSASASDSVRKRKFDATLDSADPWK